MSILVCDLCGKSHAVQDCKIFTEHEKSTDPGNIQLQIPLAYQTLPNWVYVEDNQRKLISCKEIEVSFKLGPFLAPQSSSLKRTIDFPLYLQFANNVKLWFDQSDGSKCNWLSLIPASPHSYNMVACQILDSIYFVVVRPLKIGEDLKVWYAPFYKLKIPRQILERVTSCLKGDNVLEENGELDETSLSDLSDKTQGDDSGNIFSNSSSLLSDTQLLETQYIPSSNVAFGGECAGHQPLGLSTSQNAKVLLTCSISFPSSFTTISSSSLSTSAMLPLSSGAQPLFLVPVTPTSTVGPLTSINNETSIYNSLPCLPLNMRQNEVIPVPIQNRLTQNLTDQENILQVQTIHNSISSLNSENMALESEQENASSCTKTYSSGNTFSEEVSGAQIGNRFNLHSLQNITINKSKITFTHGFSKGDSDKCSSSPSKQEERKLPSRKPSVDDIKEKKQSKTIIVKTVEERSKNRRYYFTKLPPNGVNIYVAGNDDAVDLDPGYDMISLNLTKDESHPSSEAPLYKILKRQKSLKSQHEELGSGEKDCDTTSSQLPSISNHWTCSLCPDTFAEKMHFALHLKNHLLVSLGRRFVCEVCNSHFKNQDHLKIHRKSHSNESGRNIAKGTVLREDTLSQTKNRISFVASKEQNSKENKSWRMSYECQICAKRFSNGKYLLRHLSKHCGEFVCSLCKKEFARNENLRKHLCVQKAGMSRLKCDMCKKTFKNQHFYKLHLLQHEEKVKCEGCSGIFLNHGFLQKHEKDCCLRNPQKSAVDKDRTESENDRFCCHICNRNFSSLFFLKNHVTLCEQLADVSKKGAVNCEVCGWLCAGPTKLRTHLQTHTHPYLCLSCSQRFRSRGTYEMHICSVQFPCDFCDSALRSLHELYKHVTAHGPPPLCCLRCRYPFYKKECLNEHRCQVEVKEQLESSDRKRICCLFCPALFVAEHNLKKHMASLHGVPVKQKFVCGKCGKKFHRSDLLKSHERIHLAPSLECPQCHKKFKSHRSFANHSVLHKRDFRFSCKHCNKGFAQKKDVFRHEKIHISSLAANNGPGLFKCPQCSIYFSTSHRLETHLSYHNARPLSRKSDKRVLSP